MASFRKAIAAGVDMIELDIRMTKDYHLVVMHDSTVRRTTNGTGAVCDMSLQDLKSLDAGSWYGPRFRGEQVPTLREVMEMLPSRVGLNIEVKTDGDPRPDRALEESLVLIIREQNMTSRVLVSSFDHSHLRRMHTLDPSLPLGVLYVPVRDLVRSPSAMARRCGASAFICSRTQLRKRFIDDAHKHGIVVGVYGVNTAEQYRSMTRYGIDAIVTDDPEKIARLIREK
jgi:glycerophosphoryl diester phosphodiesterase